MNSLEKWLQNLTQKPIEILNSNYFDEGVIKQEIETSVFLKKKGHSERLSYVSDSVLHEFWDKILNQACEQALWEAIFWYLAHPLPIPLAHDLIDRNVAVSMMAHTRQFDEVQWRLATLRKDALYTLIRERYVESQYSVAQFNIMLKQYWYTPYADGILYMLSFQETQSPEKEAILLKTVKRKKKHVSKFIRKRLEEFLDERLQPSTND